MDASDLRIFEAIARLGGIGRAAAELHTVQSNVTARLRALEQELGTPLFQRHARGVSLTGAGQRLLPYALRIRALLDDARRAAQDDGRPAGPLLIGSLETTAAMRLSPMLSRYAAAYPDVDLVLRTGTTCELVEQVQRHQLQAAFVCGPVEHPDLHAQTVFQEELVLLTAPGLSRLDRLNPGGECRAVVLRAGCSYRLRLEAMLARRGIIAPRLLEFGSLDAILACVAAGIGITLLPRALVEAPVHDGRIRLHELPPQEAQVDTVFVRRHDTYVPSALAAFLEMLAPARTRTLAAE